MKCEQASALFGDLLERQLTDESRQLLATHVQGCEACREQLLGIESSLDLLRQWREQPVPEWDRSLGMYGKQATPSRWWQGGGGWNFWHWSPLAASMVLALAVLFNVQLTVADGGVNLSFGNGSGTAALDQEAFQALFAGMAGELRAQQREETLDMLTTFSEQMGEANSRNLQQVVSYFERQRERDLELMEASYQQLLDSDYQTIRSMQQLVSYVQGEQQ